MCARRWCRRRARPAATASASGSRKSRANSTNISSGNCGSRPPADPTPSKRARVLFALAAGLRHAGLGCGARNRVQQIHRFLQALTTSPDSIAARAAVLSAAQVLAQQLNSMTTDIQALRSDAELGLGDAAARANNAMQQIAAINRQLAQQRRQRRRDGDAARPARHVYRRIVAPDGYQGGQDRPQPDQHLHQFRHPARRRRGLAACPSTRRAR